MREIEGILCTAKLLVPIKQELLFGPDTTSKAPYDRFVCNGLLPFAEIAIAQKALAELTKNSAFGFTKVGLAEVRLQVTGSDDEMETLKEMKNFIIVAELEDGEIRLLGRKVDNVPGVCYAPVSDLELNGFRVIPDYQKAGNQTFGALYEVRRQGRPVSSHLATFSLKRIKS